MSLIENMVAYKKIFIETLLFICFIFIVSCGKGDSYYDPCANVQNPLECRIDVDCIEGNSCWCGSCIPEQCTDVLSFSDHMLENSIRYAIDMPTGDIRYEHVRGLRKLVGICYELLCIARLDGIQCLTSLQELNLAGHGISDIGPLSSLTNISKLELYRNFRLSDVSPLSEMKNLTELNIADNEITDIGPLAELTNMIELDISNNEAYEDVDGGRVYIRISDITPLSQMTSLKKLDISMCYRLSDINPLSNMTELAELNAEYNSIEGIGPLEGLTSLTLLNLKHNDITDIAPLVDNTGISEGDQVSINANPIDCTEQASNIQALRDRGVDLDTSCP